MTDFPPGPAGVRNRLSGMKFAVTLLLLLSMAAGALAWRALDARPPRADEARHLLAALRVSRGELLFPDPGLNYPPLGYWALALGTAGNPLPERAPLAQALLLAVAALAVGGAGRSLGGPWAGFLAALALAASPLLGVVLRSAYVDLALLAAVAVALLALLRSEGLTRPGPAFAAGVAAGAAALCKFGFVLHLAVPVLLAVAGWPARPAGARWGRGAAGLALGFLATAGPWYLAAPRIFQRMADFLGGRFYSPAADAPGSAGAWAWVAWASVDWLWGLPVALAVLAGLGLAFRRGERVAAGLAACTLLPLVALAFLSHRAPHYALPELAPSALLAALPLARSRWRGAFAALLAGLVLVAAGLPLAARPGLAEGPARDVLFQAFSTVSPAGSLVGDGALLLGPPLDRRPRALGALVGAAAALATPLPPGVDPLYPLPGVAPGATVGLLEGLPPDLEVEALRYEACRQGRGLCFAVVGHDGPESLAGMLIAPEGFPAGGWLEAGRFEFPGGPVRLLVRPR